MEWRRWRALGTTISAAFVLIPAVGFDRISFGQDASSASTAPTDEFGNAIKIDPANIPRPVGLILDEPASGETGNAADLLRGRLYPGSELTKSSILDTMGGLSPLSPQLSPLDSPEQIGVRNSSPFAYPPWAVKPGGRMAPFLLNRQAALQIHSTAMSVARVTGVTGATRMGTWWTGREALQTPPDAPTMAQGLGKLNTDAYTKARAMAWSLFREGHYRRAARMFDSAATLDQTDNESRVGEIYCHFHLGATSTAVALLKELSRRAENPFAVSVNVSEHYGSAATAADQRSRSRLAVQAENVPPNALALHGFVLWYLGDRDDAIRAALSLATSDSEAFKNWPAKMKSVAGSAE